MSAPIFEMQLGHGPLVATAIHDGHEVRHELADLFVLDDLGRLREEDPHTGAWTEFSPNRVIGLRSRFEVDLNRPREKAVYRTPEDAWGLQVWKEELSNEVYERSIEEYDEFYRALKNLYAELTRQFGAFVVYDLHTYNHRREGPDAPPADPNGNPQVNIGTGTLANRAKFGGVVARLMDDLARFDFPGGNLDVRENVKFKGGNHPSWAHEQFPDSACVIAIEFKKFFMDEWSGKADKSLVNAIQDALRFTVPGVLEELEKVRPS